MKKILFLTLAFVCAHSAHAYDGFVWAYNNTGKPDCYPADANGNIPHDAASVSEDLCAGSPWAKDPLPPCADQNTFGSFVEGGGCDTFGCYYAGGGCNTFGCYDAGGGCNTFGCYYAGGHCDTQGCDEAAPDKTRECKVDSSI
jgi:hypothetical protein